MSAFTSISHSSSCLNIFHRCERKPRIARFASVFSLTSSNKGFTTTRLYFAHAQQETLQMLAYCWSQCKFQVARLFFTCIEFDGDKYLSFPQLSEVWCVCTVHQRSALRRQRLCSAFSAVAADILSLFATGYRVQPEMFKQ